jgi:mannose-6-phosphate isomerase-like protein (cupin superfamily)
MAWAPPPVKIPGLFHHGETGMRTIKPQDFTGSCAWEALDIERIDDATIRLHWTDQPYKWHVNDGPEVFVVLDGEVDMYTRAEGVESVQRLVRDDIFHAQDGDAHVAHPVGPARVLVIERAGSV